MTKQRTKRIIKAWAVLRRDEPIIDNCSLDLIYSEEEKIIYAKEIFPIKRMANAFKKNCCQRSKIVPCVITFTLPNPKVKNKEGKKV